MAKIKGYKRSDGTKVKGHTRKGSNSRKYTASQRRAFEKSKTSKSGHKTYKQRLKSKNPKKVGLWARVHAKRKREGSWKPKK